MSDNKYAGKKCFVIMPFGKKEVLDGKGNVIDTVDFNQVYDQLIKKAVEEIGIECERCDEIPESGSIHKKMFRGIFDADVALVDITSLNPNVFYELGVRHALHKFVTVVIQKKSDQPLPFNIRIPYPAGGPSRKCTLRRTASWWRAVSGLDWTPIW